MSRHTLESGTPEKPLPLQPAATQPGTGVEVQENPPPTVDPARLEHALQTLRAQQSLPLGLAAGTAAAAVGALLWGGITWATGFQIGWMAVAVGFLVGWAVRLAGKGMDSRFGVAGAALSLVGCGAGNLLAVCSLYASQSGTPLLAVLGALTPTAMRQLMVATFHPMDLLFYGIAAYEGYRFSFRQVSHAELGELLPEIRDAAAGR